MEHVWERGDVYRDLMGKHEWKRPLGRHKRRWKILKWIIKK